MTTHAHLATAWAMAAVVFCCTTPATATTATLTTTPKKTLAKTKPNILFVVTDDEDTVLGGDSDSVGAMPRGLPRLGSRGATMANWFVHTPVCACSRAEILTGRFFHNLADSCRPLGRTGQHWRPLLPESPRRRVPTTFHRPGPQHAPQLHQALSRANGFPAPRSSWVPSRGSRQVPQPSAGAPHGAARDSHWGGPGWLVRLAW
jgi:hypothetical protein